MSIHNCLISGLVEKNIFDLKSSSFKTKIDDVCPVCLIDLNKTESTVVVESMQEN